MSAVIGTYASAVVMCGVALVLGRAIAVLCGHSGAAWLAPPLGFAVLMAVCEAAVALPGHGLTAAGILVILVAGALWAGRAEPWPAVWDLLPVAGAVLVISTVPFLANGRVGVLGISILNDTHWHLFLAQGLLDPSIRHLDDYGVGYPLGPHAVSAVFAAGLGTSVDRTLTGELIAIPMLTGLAALGFLGRLARTQRWVVAVAAAIPYMAAAWYVQSAFKEPIVSLLLIGLVLVLAHGRHTGFDRPASVWVTVAVLFAGVLYDYSYPGLIWPLAGLACWLALELTVGRAWRYRRAIVRGLRASVVPIALAALVLVVLIAPDLHRIYAFWTNNGGSSVGTTGGVTQGALANLAGPLRTLEGLNLWLWGDFRFAPSGRLDAQVIPAFAVAVLVFALARAVADRELPWVGVVAGCGLVYAYTKHAQSPYVAAKALAVPAPVLVLGSLEALLRPFGHAGVPRSRRRPTWGGGLAAAAAIVFLVLSFESDLLVLRDAQVGPSNHTTELRGLRPLLHGRPTLVLFYDDYFKWELLGVPVSSPVMPSSLPVGVAPIKPWSYGQALDFDSIAPADLDRFEYVITTRTLAQSQPPPNFRLVGASRSYEVFHRLGPTPRFSVLPESGRPGAVLDCRSAAGAAIAHRAGTAAVRTAPVGVPVAPLQPGQTERLAVKLPKGRWQLSLPFVSPQGLRVAGGGLATTLPPNLDRPGSVWPVGTVTSAGPPLRLTLTMLDGGAIRSTSPSTQFFSPQPLLAVPVAGDRLIPLRAACGRYVDWYQPG